MDREARALEETVAAARARRAGRRSPRLADVGDEAAVKAYVARAAIEAFGALDVVYANAGISGGLVPLFEQKRRSIGRRSCAST